MGDWPTAKVAELQDDGVLLVEDGNHGEYRPRQNEFGSGTTAFIRAADMDAGRVLFETAARISDEAVARIRKGFGKGGDILFSHKGTVGKLAITPFDAPPFVCSPQTTFWRVLDERRLDRGFLYTFMRSRRFEDQWRARKGETDMADYVSLTAQRQLWVALPEIREQQQIARTLGALDDKIELNRQMNPTLEAMAQAIFRSWFVDFDPVTAKAAGRQPFGMSAEMAALFPDRFVDSPLGPIPEGWEVGAISDLARFVNGRNFTKGASGTGRMVVRIAELNSGPGASTVYSDAQADPENTAYSDDILFAWSGSLNVYRWHRGDALINQHIFKVICERFPKWFVYYHLQEAMPEFQAIAAGKATTMGHIKRSHLDEAAIVEPPGSLVARASSFISPIYEKIHTSESESATLGRLRDLLLPKLLSGEIPVGQAEKVVQEAV